MEPSKPNHMYTIRYTLKREQITDFLNQLEDMRQDYMEAAVEASKFKDANEVINHIKSL
ncbi:hypothetical protein UFOVP71_238 [uncultured Caudovirales phage]|uniref:Uncharacterized protein n=1 Tax=uncultured Caudovirales phage TaxID=2100421 RepID=A0A6J5TDI3_9CAUD|nr:hypothetical protein UFOVP71_238 [uncultured Caudovirales phage]